MSRLVLDDFTTLWSMEPDSAWALSLIATTDAVGKLGPALQIESSGSTGSGSARRVFSSPADLRAFDAIEVCLRSSRSADGTPAGPFYLAAECYDSVAATVPLWQRLLPVTAAGAWQYHDLSIDDMPGSLRGAVAAFSLRAIGPQVPFEATVDRLLAVRNEPITDAEAALRRRLDLQFLVSVGGTPTPVPMIVDLPENPGTRTLPYILTSPWSIQVQRAGGAGGQIIDNFTAYGASYRQSAGTIALEYRIDVFATDRQQKTSALDAIVSEFVRYPLIEVRGRPVECASFWPGKEQLLQWAGLGRAPLFYRLTLPVEIASATWAATAAPFLKLEQPGGGTTVEIQGI